VTEKIDLTKPSNGPIVDLDKWFSPAHYVRQNCVLTAISNPKSKNVLLITTNIGKPEFINGRTRS
jgi:hypothetical protein